ncbi:MAG: response regulator [Eubacteriales bacterium]|nr:response regulator [Eubacteriales bacterium]
MLKVFLVEDEVVVRRGIKKNIAWEEHNYEFAGEASDGELALPLIRKARPDILITDIKMPFMDGLELSRIVKKEFPETEIIILSGYGEFSYAREAIQLGVSSYLLKPISGDALIKEIDQVAERLLLQRAEKAIQEKYRLEMLDNARPDRSRLFRDLVSGEKTVSELLDLAETFEIDLSASCYSIVLIKLSASDRDPQHFSGALVQANEELESLGGPNLLLFDRDLEGYAVLIKADSEETLLETREALTARIREIAERYPGLYYAVGLGSTTERLRGLKESFDSACQAFAHRYFTAGSCIIDSAAPAAPAADEDIDIQSIDPQAINTDRIAEFLRTGNAQEVPYFVEDFFRDIGNAAGNSILFRQYILLDLFFCTASFVEGLQQSRDELPAPDVNKCMSMGGEFARSYMKELLTKALAIRERAASNRYDAMVADTIRYIENHYADPDLTLNMAASHVRFSPNYLSRIFSEQTGQTFIKFLTDYRMNKAKELLRCTTKKSSEIAYDVGYKDPHYFSFLFKKQTGISPKQFRGGEQPD